MEHVCHEVGEDWCLGASRSPQGYVRASEESGDLRRSVENRVEEFKDGMIIRIECTAQISPQAQNKEQSGLERWRR